MYVCDFETTTTENDCRVWGWAINEVATNNFRCGTNINEFFASLFSEKKDLTIYFHNLKFDGQFIMYWLFENGFKHSKDRKIYNKEFSTLITHMGVWYSIKLKYNGYTITIYDSLKVIPLSVSQISSAFGIEQVKGEIDYNMERPIGYQLTENEIDYIRNDVQIVSEAMMYFLNKDLKKMTQASNALHDYKKTIGKKNFDRWFPVLDCDSFLRKSYKGGWTYVNPKYQGKVIGKGIVFDVNSLYPSVMRNEMLPYGEPIHYNGKYEHDKFYPLYVQQFQCNFELKPNHHPTIQLKKTLGFNDTEYLTDSNGEDVILTLTSVDLELFFEHYDVYNIEWFEGWKFKATDKLFVDYIDKWIAIKEEATITKNNGLRTLAKLMLNALYGKFGLNPIVCSKIPVYIDGVVKYATEEKEEREPLYVAIASFITSYARKITITGAQKNFERFLYGDTDSLHLLGHEIPDNIVVDDVKLGAWKEESKFTRAKFLRQKSYVEEIDGKTHVTCAGLPKQARSSVTFEQFEKGLKVGGKLQFKTVKGGAILKDTDFTIKD